MNLTRRRVLTAGASVAVGAFFGTGRAFATVEDVEAAIAEFAGGKEPAEGVLTLTTPEIAENGNSVPIAVAVDSPMTDSDYVDSVIIFADGNPNPEVVTFNFSPASGEATASTRMRLAKTQNVVAGAKMSNGDVFKMSNNVKVTIGGCGG